MAFEHFVKSTIQSRRWSNCSLFNNARISKAPGHTSPPWTESLSIAWLLTLFVFLLEMYHFSCFTFPNSQNSCYWLQIFTCRQPPFPANKLAYHQYTKTHDSALTTCRRAERLAPLLCLPLCNHWRWTAAPDVRWNQCNGYMNGWEEEQSLLLSSHKEMLLRVKWTRDFIYL